MKFYDSSKKDLRREKGPSELFLILQIPFSSSSPSFTAPVLCIIFIILVVVINKKNITTAIIIFIAI
jgi:hypothetical protein